MEWAIIFLNLRLENVFGAWVKLGRFFFVVFLMLFGVNSASRNKTKLFFWSVIYEVLSAFRCKFYRFGMEFSILLSFSGAFMLKVCDFDVLMLSPISPHLNCPIIPFMNAAVKYSRTLARTQPGCALVSDSHSLDRKGIFSLVWKGPRPETRTSKKAPKKHLL
ncbi:hypothetical protein NQ315_010797 [Exocentrus adspersus]|uniref:Uncharacterized protein n=1 Tax=Exocentrus adspersus TaxID=1586481 RepID=A0AAV8VUI6_9CUCU|nr:hypothetical protein NQ315_010797 [Exocentrus adspersus]